MMHPSVLSLELANLQHERLQGARARLLRVARIAHREAVLELGAGHGLAALELAGRCGHPVTAVDLDQTLVDRVNEQFGNDVCAQRADAHELPFDNASFDVVFAQFAFLWFADTAVALEEALRVLRPGGALVAIEPDFQAMIEYPTDLGLRDLWVSALQRAGGCPQIGRRLAWIASQSCPSTDILLPERLMPVASDGVEFLTPMLGGESEIGQAEQIRRRMSSERALVHLPLMLLHSQPQPA